MPSAHFAKINPFHVFNQKYRFYSCIDHVPTGPETRSHTALPQKRKANRTMPMHKRRFTARNHQALLQNRVPLSIRSVCVQPPVAPTPRALGRLAKATRYTVFLVAQVRLPQHEPVECGPHDPDWPATPTSQRASYLEQASTQNTQQATSCQPLNLLSLVQESVHSV